MKCSECNGTGKYIGFTATEACKACEGTGLGLMCVEVVPVDLPEKHMKVGLPAPGTPWVEPEKDVVAEYLASIRNYMLSCGISLAEVEIMLGNICQPAS